MSPTVSRIRINKIVKQRISFEPIYASRRIKCAAVFVYATLQFIYHCPIHTHTHSLGFGNKPQKQFTCHHRWARMVCTLTHTHTLVDVFCQPIRECVHNFARERALGSNALPKHRFVSKNNKYTHRHSSYINNVNM